MLAHHGSRSARLGRPLRSLHHAIRTGSATRARLTVGKVGPVLRRGHRRTWTLRLRFGHRRTRRAFHAGSDLRSVVTALVPARVAGLRRSPRAIAAGCCFTALRLLAMIAWFVAARRLRAVPLVAGFARAVALRLPVAISLGTLAITGGLHFVGRDLVVLVAVEPAQDLAGSV